MKKIHFLAAALLCGGVAFAQNVSTTTQSGDYNTADVDQTGINEATITQQSGATKAADGNTAEISQNSSSMKSTATIQQGTIPSPFVKKTEAYITQSGAGDNDATILQNHTGQNGNNAKSEIIQAGESNHAKTTMLGHQGQFELTRIEQTGKNNWAEQLKDDEREGQLLITQDNSAAGAAGTGNWAYQETGKDHARLLEIVQTGDGNIADQYSYKASWNKTYQTGEGNEAYQKQSTGFDHEATVTQTGNYNDAYVDQNTSGGTGHDLILLQDGDYNMADVDQTGATQSADIDVDGSYNTTDLIQTGSSNIADMDIIGSNNIMTVTQNGTGHMATESINGNNNTITVTQND